MRKKILVIGLIVTLIGGGALVVSRVFFLWMIRVPTGAMANTIVPGDRLVVKRLLGSINRGDIVVFRYPNQPSTYFVARIIGMPGETIQVRDKSVYINGHELSERKITVKPVYILQDQLEELTSEGAGPYAVFYFQRNKASEELIQRDYKDAAFAIQQPYTIPTGEYFMLGDNRDYSYDSRMQGTVPRELIWGRPSTIYWSSYTDASRNERIRWNRISRRIQ
jgi:signal peptidase I